MSAPDKIVHWSVVRRFIGHFRPYRRQATLSLIPVSVALSILFPWMIMRLIDDQLVPGESATTASWPPNHRCPPWRVEPG